MTTSAYVSFNCPKCDATLKIKSQIARLKQTIICIKCKKRIPIPKSAAPETADAQKQNADDAVNGKGVAPPGDTDKQPEQFAPPDGKPVPPPAEPSSTGTDSGTGPSAPAKAAATGDGGQTPSPSHAKIEFPCPGCGRLFSVDARLKGRKVRCSKCKKLATIMPVAAASSLSTGSPQPETTESHPIPEQDSAAKPPPHIEEPEEEQTDDKVPDDNNVETPLSGAGDDHDEPSAPQSAELAELRQSMRRAEKSLADVTAKRNNDEIAYSRTISTLSNQLDSVSRRCDELHADNLSLQEQHRQLEQRRQRDLAAAAQKMKTIKAAVDEFCGVQLSAMQELRKHIKEMIGQ